MQWSLDYDNPLREARINPILQRPALWYLAAAVVLITAQVLLVDAVAPLLADHRLIENDSYTWLGRVQRLHDGVPWYSEAEPRANWPDGDNLHYNRPFDVLLLAGGLALAPVLGFEAGLFWWGALVSPVLYLILGATLAWAVGPLLGRWRGPLVILLLSSQSGVLNYAAPGRADHHLLLMILFVLTWGLVSRLLQQPDQGRNAQRAGVVAGIVAGFGLWLSLELMLMLAACFAALLLSWMRRGAGVPAAALWFSGGLAGMCALAVLAENPPGQLLSVHYDRISIVHFAITVLAWAFWKLINWAESPDRPPRTSKERLVLGLWAAAVAVGAIGVLFPKFFLSPIGGMDPRADFMLVDHIIEEHGLWPHDFFGLRELGLRLWIGVLGLPALAYLWWRDRAAPGRDLWLFMGVGLLIYIPAALFMRRFAPYAELLLLVVATEFLVRWVQGAERPVPGAPRRLAAVLVTASALLAVALNTATVARGVARLPDCWNGLNGLAEYLNAEGVRNNTTFTIAALPDLGPELLYRTPHRVIATPTRSNEAGAIVLYDLLFGAAGDAAAHALADERGIDLILRCRVVELTGPERFGATLYARLQRGELPDWLTKLRLPLVLQQDYELYAVRRPAVK